MRLDDSCDSTTRDDRINVTKTWSRSSICIKLQINKNLLQQQTFSTKENYVHRLRWYNFSEWISIRFSYIYLKMNSKVKMSELMTFGHIFFNVRYNDFLTISFSHSSITSCQFRQYVYSGLFYWISFIRRNPTLFSSRYQIIPCILNEKYF